MIASADHPNAPDEDQKADRWREMLRTLKGVFSCENC